MEYQIVYADKMWNYDICSWCGNFIKSGDALVVLFIPEVIRRKYRKLYRTAFLHKEEFETLVAVHGTNSEAIYRDINAKQGEIRERMEKRGRKRR